MLTDDQELEVLGYDIARLEQRLASMERAPYEGRWTGGKIQHMDAVANMRRRIQVLREERAGLAARLDADMALIEGRA